MIPLFPSCTWAWIINKVIFFVVAVFEMYLHCFMVAFVVRLSNLLFCDIWSSFFTQNDPFILRYYSLIVTVIVYHVPSIQVSVFIQLITILSQPITLKRLTSCLLANICDYNLTTCFIGFISVLCSLSKVYKLWLTYTWVLQGKLKIIK